MKPVFLQRSILVAVSLLLFLTGCASSTIEKRRTERSAAYAAWPAEVRELVDQGQIKVGLSPDAVYVAWGQPSQIIQGESTGGPQTIWLYHGTSYQEYRYWGYRYHGSGRRGYAHAVPTMEYDYIPQNYVAAEVVFEGGVVKSWKNATPRP